MSSPVEVILKFNMGTNLESFQKAIFNISHDQNVVNSLSDIKIALSALNTNQLKYTSSSLNLSGVFDCLNCSQKNQIELACEVLKTFLSALDPSNILSHYGVAMLRALKHPDVQVKELVLCQLNRAACESDLAPRLSQEQDLLLCVVECVGHKEIAVARGSIRYLIRLGTFTPGLQALYSPEVLRALEGVMLTNDTNRFRVYEVVVEVSANSVPGLEASHASGLLQKILEELHNEDDVLVILTALEFVTVLALTHHGYAYLNKYRIIQYLATRFSLEDPDPLMSLLLPGLIKFFGNVAQLRPQETFEHYPEAMKTIFKTIQNGPPTLVCVALETIGYIATTVSGKRTLYKQEVRVMEKVMAKITDIVVKWPAENRVSALNALANIVHLELGNQDTDMLAIVQNWFAMLGPSTQVMAKVMDLALQPFPEIKLAVLLLLHVLSKQPWGQQLIHNTPGLVELVLDRSSDSTMQEKSARFAVINTLSESPTAEAVFSEETVKRFKTFTKEGAVYVQIQTEVAIEKAN